MDEAAAPLGRMVGTCQAIFDIVHTYVGEREQFGVKDRLLLQAIKHKLANMFRGLESARARPIRRLTIAEDDDRRRLAVATAKASVSDCQRLIAQEGIQLLGGIGYTWSTTCTCM